MSLQASIIAMVMGVSLACLLCHPGLAGGGQETSATWAEMLEHALAAQPEDKAALEQIRAASDFDQELRRLAQFLLDEWGVPRSNQRFNRPVVAWLPPVAFDKLPTYARQVSSPVIIVSGIVNRQGKLENPQLIQSSGSALLDQVALDVAEDAFFRPARSRRNYIPGRVAITVHTDPR